MVTVRQLLTEKGNRVLSVVPDSTVFDAIRKKGTQREMLDNMQTRAELYEFLGYHAFEEKLDSIFSKGENQ